MQTSWTNSTFSVRYGDWAHITVNENVLLLFLLFICFPSPLMHDIFKWCACGLKSDTKKKKAEVI